MFGAIIVSGINMMNSCEWNEKTTLIVATSLCVGIGVTQVDGFFQYLPYVFGDIFAGNPVAGVFVVSMIMSLIITDREKKN